VYAAVTGITLPKNLSLPVLRVMPQQPETQIDLAETEVKTGDMIDSMVNEHETVRRLDH
jgi:translation elongation factor EF-1beta